jgi:broad specificity phosphatase PhoE
MPNLILVKHSKPEIKPSVTASKWELSVEGRKLCMRLAEDLAKHNPTYIVASLEPKATETAKLVAEKLALSFETAEGLHEHDRTNTPYYDSPAVVAFFAQPHNLVYGSETAQQALERFKKVVETIVAKHPQANLVVVAHGTVITLLVADYCGIEPFSFWKELSLPSFVVLSVPERKLIKVVNIHQPD